MYDGLKGEVEETLLACKLDARYLGASLVVINTHVVGQPARVRGGGER